MNKKQIYMKRIYSFPTIGLIIAIILGAQLASAQNFFTVEIKGKGQPIIFIPGLYSNGEVWNDILPHYEKNYECHIITLAGFGGNAPKLKENFLESVKDDLIAYAKKKKLNHPILIGHSMGAFLSLWAASSASDVFGKVIAVDGAPFLPALIQPQATVESGRFMAEQIKNGMAQQTPAQAAEYLNVMFSTMITAQENIDRVKAIAAKADASTQTQVMYEMYTTDLRASMASVKNPVLVLGAWIAYTNYGVTHASTVANYGSQLAAAKNVTIEVTDTAKHFIFYDEPQWFMEKVDAFLKK
jgi:pimeloyl-ACP methyl ester carboxylesterase